MMQSHLPSPARLGMSASSPSLPPTATPPNPTSSPPLPAPTQTPTLTTSPSLLPLLPPLPRAQSLLLLISSLASNLFDLSPHRTAWLSSYRGALPNFLPSSSSGPPPPLPSPVSSTKDALSLLTSLQTQLFEAVAELQEILELHDARGRLAREACAKDSALLAFAKKLREAHQVLDRVVDDYSDYRRDPKLPRLAADGPEPVSDGDFGASLHSRLELDDVLTYAHRISYTTFAPPEHGAGLAPLRGALPPAPQENEMRASQLYQFADLDVGVPKKPLEAKERSAADVEPAPLLEPTPPREELPPPPMLPIAVPSGWKKGMPVELPSNIPLPPPGWKPGDPITLPPDLVGTKVEETQVGVLHPPLGVQQVAPKGPEPIQVKPVQLDIDDDYSSEYSSEVGSSEEDDED